jgi:hypothetical protein
LKACELLDAELPATSAAVGIVSSRRRRNYSHLFPGCTSVIAAERSEVAGMDTSVCCINAALRQRVFHRADAQSKLEKEKRSCWFTALDPAALDSAEVTGARDR